MAGPVRQPDLGEHRQGTLTGDRRLGSTHDERQLDILDGAQDRQQVEGLENEAHVVGPVVGAFIVRQVGQVGTVDLDCAFGDGIEARKAVEQGCLAGTRRAHDGDHLAGLDDEVNALESMHPDVTVGEDLVNAGGFDGRRRGC